MKACNARFHLTHSNRFFSFQGCPIGARNCPRFNVTEPCPPDPRTGIDVVLNCNASHVLHLNFAEQPLNGILTSAIGRLTALTRLDIYNNRNLRGRIPDTIRRLSKLTFLCVKPQQFLGLHNFSYTIQSSCIK